jgi:hypothetical protein
VFGSLRVIGDDINVAGELPCPELLSVSRLCK